MRKFNVRGFVSLVLGFSFVVVLVSGLVLWLTHSPSTWGIGRGVWKYSHIYASLLMSGAAIGHFVLNWSAFLGYLRSKASDRKALKWEALFALLLVVLMIGAAVMRGPSSRRGHGPPNAHGVERPKS